MKYALIGCGRIAVNHLRAAVNNHFEIVAFCDIDPEKIDALCRNNSYEGSAAHYTDYKTMLAEHPELELVAIATPSGMHARIALTCIEHGVNVLIEKPMAMSMADADAIVAAAEKYGVKVSVCQQNRFNAAVQETRKALEAGRFGRISHGTIHVRWRRTPEYYALADWRGKWESDGGCLFNQCIHGMDLLRWMLGDEISEVYGVTSRRFHDCMEAEDLGTAIVKFKNGAVGMVEGTVNVFRDDLEECLYLFGEKGTVRIGGTSTNNIDIWDFADETEEDLAKKGMKTVVGNVYGHGHTLLYADMAEAIQTDRKPYVDAVAGRNAVELVLAVYQSAASGKPVPLPLKDVASTDFIGRF